MKLWLDAQFSPAIASWIEEAFAVDEAFAIQVDVALRCTKDHQLFELRQGEPLVEISDLE